MSTSLRDQLLKAGLINKKQVNEAERQLQRVERRPPPKGHNTADAGRDASLRHVQPEKAARDQALNRRQREKAERKALFAQVKQLISQNRIPASQGGETYSFIDAGKVRRIPIDAALRARLSRGDIAIVHHDSSYELVPAAIAARIRERDAGAVVAKADVAQSQESDPRRHIDEGYPGFEVPDDLIW